MYLSFHNQLILFHSLHIALNDSLQLSLHSHLLCYATGDTPYGPFTYQGVVLEPVVGWTTHHCIVEFKGQWYLLYHDCVPSGGVTHLRSLKVQQLFYNEDGTIKTVVNE